jgi:hypothetical protein
VGINVNNEEMARHTERTEEEETEGGQKVKKKKFQMDV